MKFKILCCISLTERSLPLFYSKKAFLMATVCCCNVIKMDFEDKISNFMTKIIIQLFVLKYMFSITKD